MATAEFSSVTFEAVHVPETHRTLENDHTVSSVELPGMVDVYIVIDGARLLFTQYKAGKVFDALAARDAQAAANPPSQAAPTTPEQSTPPTQEAGQSAPSEPPAQV